jgi:NOL1/NOP2/sun family putative RNA methylase
MKNNKNYLPKAEFIRRINLLLPDKTDRDLFWKILKSEAPKTIRCNTLKISPDKLKQKLENKSWKIKQPFSKHPEIMIIDKKSNLQPGELGKSAEHLIGYYYIQEISSMLPILALNPKQEDLSFDCCAAPGSKTTQAASLMENKGTIIANDKNIGRLKILISNLERCGCTNTIITRQDSVQLCKKLENIGMKFDKILLDVPCSGEGTLRSSPKTFLMWNLKVIEKLSRLQKKISASAIPLLKQDGEIIYSTCTHTPEENEEVVSFLIKNFNLKLQSINLPKEIKTRQGITSWQGKKFHPDMKKAVRIWPQDNNTEGFFIAKLKKSY